MNLNRSRSRPTPDSGSTVTESTLIIAGVLTMVYSACERWLVTPPYFLPIYASVAAVILWLLV